jgi:hypothetical protein
LDPPPLCPVLSTRLSAIQEQWDSIVSNEWSSRIVREGLKLQFKKDFDPERLPVTRVGRHRPSQDDSAIDLMIQEYVDKGALEEIRPVAEQHEVISSVFTLPKPGSQERRMVLNLRWLNQLLPFRHFKSEGYHTLNDILKPGDFMVKVDFKDAFLHLSLNQASRRYCRFWHRGRKYQAKTMFFGLTHAPWVFTKLVRKVLSVLRREGLRIVHFIDDFLIAASSLTLLQSQTARFIQVFQDLGFLLHPKKVMLFPSTKIEFLGLCWDTGDRAISLPEDKRRALRRVVSRMARRGASVKLRDLARLLGQIQFAKLAVPLARLHSASLLQLQRDALRKDHDWRALICIPPHAREELLAWESRLETEVSRPFLLDHSPTVLHGRWDAAKTGWGGYATWEGRRLTARGAFSPMEANQSSNVRESLAQTYGWTAILSQIPEEKREGLLIRAGSDNSSWVSYATREGGRFLHLNRLILDFFELLQSNKVRLQAYHVPGVENLLADRLSRMPVDRHPPLSVNRDWIRTHLFPQIGHPDLDLFATRQTSLAPRFVSRVADSQAWATNAFSLDWMALPRRVWMFPPPSLIPRILRRLPWSPTDFWMLVPLWEAHAWFPLLWEAAVGWPILLPDLPGLFSEGVRWPMIALPTSGSLLRRTAFRRELSPQSLQAWADQPDRGIRSGVLSPTLHLPVETVRASLLRLSLWSS